MWPFEQSTSTPEIAICSALYLMVVAVFQKNVCEEIATLDKN